MLWYLLKSKIDSSPRFCFKIFDETRDGIEIKKLLQNEDAMKYYDVKIFFFVYNSTSQMGNTYSDKEVEAELKKLRTKEVKDVLRRNSWVIQRRGTGEFVGYAVFATYSNDGDGNCWTRIQLIVQPTFWGETSSYCILD